MVRCNSKRKRIIFMYLLGVPVTIIGFGLTVFAFSGPSRWASSTEKRNLQNSKVVGPIFLGIGLLLLIIGFIKIWQEIRTEGTAVYQLSQADAVAIQQVVAQYSETIGANIQPYGGGQVPQGPYPYPNSNMAEAAVKMQQLLGNYMAGQQYPPPGQQYPPPGQQYPPPGHQYPPPEQQFPPPAYPPQPAGGYPPPQSYPPPPLTADGFPEQSDYTPPPPLQ